MKRRYTQEEIEIIYKLAKKNNVKPEAIQHRLVKFNYDFTKVDFPNKEVRYKYYLNGVPAVRIAESNGINKHKFNSRMKLGWDLQKACTFKEPSIKEIMRKTGLSRNKIQNLIYVKRIPKIEVLNGTFNNTDKSQG